MKRSYFLPALAFASALSAQELPKASPRAQVSQVVGLTKVTVDHGRPSANGRAIFGGLVPYGEVWRTGANECTTITFDGPVQFGKTQVAAGTYALFTVPSERTFRVILNSDAKQWGAYAYKSELDIASVEAAPEKCAATEVFTIGFGAFAQDAARLDLMWAETRVSVWITAPSDERAKANIAEALAKPDAGSGTYSESAEFYLTRHIDDAQALAWAHKSVEMKKMYWNNFTLALALHATGAVQEAIAAAEESAALAKAEGDTGAQQTYTAQSAAWRSAGK
ncbi:MAG: DUF2911 domain-containing protein [Flavobacteriales bacterium]